MSIRLPAEWEPQSGLLITWPHAETDWRPYLHDAETVFVEITRHVSAVQPVIIACHDESHRTHVEKLLQHNVVRPDTCRLHIAPSNDSWVRDHGPITVLQDNKPLLLDFTFNGWGEKYPAGLDNKITSVLHSTNAFGQTPLSKINFVLEGGSIETDGLGTLLTTTSCLLSPQRNKGLAQAQIEAKLAEYLGARRTIWLKHGQLSGDDTNGHIDTLVRFINTGTLVYVACSDPDNPNYESLNLMATELRSLMQANGKPYQLISLPCPIIMDDDSGYLPASYANFLICNDLVLVPLYDTDTDNEALEIFNECFADRKIIGIHCRPLIRQFGSLHCVTMQLPSGVVT